MKKHNHRLCSIPWHHGAWPETLRRRVTYGGRKGRRAAARLQQVRCTAPPRDVARYLRRIREWGWRPH